MNCETDKNTFIYIYTKKLKSNFNFPNLPKSCLWVGNKLDEKTMFVEHCYSCDINDLEEVETVIQETLEILRIEGLIESYKIRI
jgi:hypothetical protein